MGGAFSILWPTKNSKYGDQVNRDFFADEKNESKKISISKSIMTNLPRETCTLISPQKPEGNRFLIFFRIFQKFLWTPQKRASISTKYNHFPIEHSIQLLFLSYVIYNKNVFELNILLENACIYVDSRVYMYFNYYM